MAAWWSKLEEKAPDPSNVGNSRIIRLVYWLAIIFISCLILLVGFLPNSVNLKVGEIATEDVFYEGVNTQYISDIATNQAKNDAALQVEQIYRLDDRVLQSLNGDVINIFSSIITVQSASGMEDDAARIAFLQDSLGITLTDDALKIALDTTESNLMLWQELLQNILNDGLKNGVTADNLQHAKDAMLAAIEKLTVSSKCKELLTAVYNSLDIQPNMVYDLLATNEERDKVMAEVQPVQITVKQGEKLLSKGSAVTEQELEKLQKLGLYADTNRLLPFLGLLIFVIGLYGLLIAYLKAFYPKVSKQVSNVILIGLLFILFLILAKIFCLLQTSIKTPYAPLIGYIIPTSVFSMLFAVLFNNQIAVWATITMGLFLAVMSSGQFIYPLLGLIGGFAGIYKVSKVSQRGQLMMAGLSVAVANIITIVAWGFMWQQSSEMILFGILVGLLNGILSSILTIGILPFLESAFHITTVIRLLELANSNHPLLKQLMMEAPGTYYHSVLVGNLAEMAADAVGANSLLVRVASYFHDIGKVKRPIFFIENQKGENPHDKLQPTLSTLIITSHVKDGVEILKANHFPREVIDIVEQHHGSGILSFFYNKALSMEGNSIDEKNFRYPGPKPQTKEAAIVMLADSVQAAVQSMKNPAKGAVDGKVREIIKAKFESGQLMECDLTFRDLNTIAQAFCMVLAGVQHSRIVYPAAGKQGEKNKNAVTVEQPIESLSWASGEDGLLSGSADDMQADQHESAHTETSGDQPNHNK